LKQIVLRWSETAPMAQDHIRVRQSRMLTTQCALLDPSWISLDAVFAVVEISVVSAGELCNSFVRTSTDLVGLVDLFQHMEGHFCLFPCFNPFGYSFGEASEAVGVLLKQFGRTGHLDQD
jgi:hypothetical protein